MACDTNTKLLISCYADGEATPEEAARARAHLDDCSECRKTLVSWQEHRELLEWAYTSELPEETRIEWQDDLAGTERRMSIAEKISTLTGWTRRRGSLTWVGALAAAVIVGIVIHHFAVMPPTLKVGTQMASTRVSRSARIGGGILLTLGPQTKISRIDEKSIRLENGWIAASVRHGSGLRVLSRRLQVVDIGTRFRVGSGPRMDYVWVDEGLVLVSKGASKNKVRAGQFLIAQDNGKPYIASVPKGVRQNHERGTTKLGERGKSFVPATAREMDWEEGLNRLAIRFPDAEPGSGGGSGISVPNDDFEMRYGIKGCAEVATGLREHLEEIVEAGAGGRTAKQWEIPVCYLMVDGITAPSPLPADVYYVRLVSDGGYLGWRLSGSKGNDAIFPLAFGNESTHGQGYLRSGGSLEPIQYDYSVSGRADREFNIRLSDWPGDLKPELSLRLRSVKSSEVRKEERKALSWLVSSLPDVDFLKHVTNPTILYLDTNRRDRFIIAWDSSAGKALYLLHNRASRGEGGSVVVGAIFTDAIMDLPALPSSAANQTGFSASRRTGPWFGFRSGRGYLLQFVQPPAGGAARLEFVHPSGRVFPMPKSTPEAEMKGVHSSAFVTPDGHEDVMNAYVTAWAKRNGFPLGFQICGRSTEDVWAEGWIRVKKP